jgi:hypothetical protein
MLNETGSSLGDGDGHTTIEHERIGLVAERIDVGAAVLLADDESRSTGAGATLVRAVRVLVASVEGIEVTGPVGHVDRHVNGSRLLQVEDPRVAADRQVA